MKTNESSFSQNNHSWIENMWIQVCSLWAYYIEWVFDKNQKGSRRTMTICWDDRCFIISYAICLWKNEIVFFSKINDKHLQGNTFETLTWRKQKRSKLTKFWNFYINVLKKSVIFSLTKCCSKLSMSFGAKTFWIIFLSNRIIQRKETNVNRNVTKLLIKITWHDCNGMFDLRHPDIGVAFRSCIVKPHNPIEASIHAKISKLDIMNILHGTTNIVKIAVWKWIRNIVMKCLHNYYLFKKSYSNIANKLVYITTALLKYFSISGSIACLLGMEVHVNQLNMNSFREQFWKNFFIEKKKNILHVVSNLYLPKMISIARVGKFSHSL